eukprot:IDg21208t1
MTVPAVITVEITATLAAAHAAAHTTRASFCRNLGKHYPAYPRTPSLDPCSAKAYRFGLLPESMADSGRAE